MNLSTRFSVIALSLAAPLTLCAQTQADVIQALLARIDKLEKRVAELETRSPSRPGPSRECLTASWRRSRPSSVMQPPVQGLEC